MKKKIFAAAVAFVATMSLATSAFAATPGATNGSASTEVKVEADKATEFTTDMGLTIEAPAGAFEAGTDVKLEAKVDYVKSAPNTTATVEAAIAKLANVSASDAKVTLNTVVQVSLTANGATIQPNGNVKVTVAYDGKSNGVAYVNGNNVEFIKLVKDGNFCSFETSHFSDYYLVTVDEAVFEKVAGQSTTVDGSGSNTNPGTGIALAVAPAGLAVAFVGVTAVISKKKR